MFFIIFKLIYVSCLVKTDVVGIANQNTQLGFGRNDIQNCRAGRLSYRAIEAMRKTIIGQLHHAMCEQFQRNGKIWVRVLVDLPITEKPIGWIARVSTGQIPFEIVSMKITCH